ncbi:hypothetical protein IFM89_003895 [Coptis chinensis]|uniref:F-box domain-containing protein n=1 Tax=Coptis chinensis TaxID=261450 RepID=A0A835LUI4_9MAGN|nr:hypothetical protein IFM89_003895 [Coptis chinensis]
MKTTRTCLPFELVAEILSWLPAKCLLKFMCVSKTWLRLLKTDSHFINLHLHHSIQANHSSILLLRKHDDTEMIQYYHAEAETENTSKAIELELPLTSSSYYLVGIRNGLICLTKKDYSDLCIWNPLTKEHITIPCPPFIPSHFRSRIANLHFGFGFIQGTNEYKVIRIVSSCYDDINARKDYHSLVSVYTLGGIGSWRDLDDVSYYFGRPSAPLVNGSLHWLVFGETKMDWGYYNVIVSFDIKDEVFQELPWPKGVNRFKECTHKEIVELGGVLWYVRCWYGKEAVAWVMKDYGVDGSWTKLYRVESPGICGEFSWLKPLGVANSGEIVLAKDGRKLMMFNPQTNSITKLNEFGFQDADGCMGFRASCPLHLADVLSYYD